MKQWHPIFVHLLRPVIEPHFEVRTTMTVGDMPREADIVLLRRRSAGALPFRGLWRHLRMWNVLEFKGPTVSPRLRDIDALVELGLGIDRRLNEDRVRRGQRELEPGEVSFWLLANRLGRRFLRGARDRLGALEQLGDGIWRCELLQRMVFLVSSVELPVEEDSLPLHLIGKEPPETEQATARFVAENDALWERYGPWLAYLHRDSWEEVYTMARKAGRVPEPSFKFLLKLTEDENLKEELVEFLVKQLMDKLSPAQREKLKRKLKASS